MNIQVQLCGLSILVLLLIFYKSHNTLRLYKERVFYAVLCIITVSLSGDILSLIAIYFRNRLPSPLVTFVCKSYIITLIWGTWSALVYVLTDMVSEKQHRTITNRLLMLGAIQSLIVYLLPIHIYEEGAQVYTYGAAVLVVYVFVAIYIVATLAAAWLLRKRLNPRRALAIMLWMAIWISSAVIQFINSALLIVGFASALGVLILFVLMENPEANLERRLGCFNAYALTEYINQRYAHKKEFSVMEITFDSSGLSDGQSMDIDALMRQILHMVERKRNILAFKNINLSLVLICDQTELLEATGQEILATFSDIESFEKSTMLILTETASAFSDMEELFRFFSFVRTSCKDERGQLIIADDPMIAKFTERYLIEQEIAEALANDRVEVFFQPIYSNIDHDFTSAEALVRIRNRDGALLSPGQFIPVAEDNGQILALGERVFEKVCEFLQQSDVRNRGIRYIEINLSVVQCEKLDLAERLISITEKYQIDPSLINLEITETASISARKTLLENMTQLIEYGFSFSLDDFGKGESNLMYVVEMPVSIVKLDMDMSKAFFNTPKAKQVVRAVVSMAHGMGLKLVAEGIETEYETHAIRQEGIDYIQGFFYSKPLPMQEFLMFLDTNACAVEA